MRAWAAHTLEVPEQFIEPLQLVRYTDDQHMGLLDSCTGPVKVAEHHVIELC